MSPTLADPTDPTDPTDSDVSQDRIKLIQSQMEGTPVNNHCCGLDLRYLRAAESIAAVS